MLCVQIIVNTSSSNTISPTSCIRTTTKTGGDLCQMSDPFCCVDQDIMVSHNVLNCHLHFCYAIIKIIVSL